MVFEKIRVGSLNDAIKQISVYLEKWDPLLYGTEVEELRRSRSIPGGWTIIFTREGSLI